MNEETVPNGKRKFTFVNHTFIVSSRYECVKLIGFGVFRASVSALDHIRNKTVLIIKISSVFEDLDDAKKVLREIKLLNFLSHENVINLLGIEIYERTENHTDIYIIMDLMETDLQRVIRSNQELSNDHYKYFMYQLLRGVFYMHSANVIHFDLKPAYLLLNRNCDLKISEFENAKGYGREVKPLNEYICARWYRPPEIRLNSLKYTKEIDIWSCGCIFAELLGRAPIFPDTCTSNYFDMITHQLGTPSQEDIDYFDSPEIRAFISGLPKREKQSWSVRYPRADPLALDLIDKMLVFNPEKRLTAKQCLAHPYFQEFHDLEDEPLARGPFNWSFEDSELSVNAIKNFLYGEASISRQN